MQAVMTTISTQSSTSTWHAPCSILYVETWCWAAGGITVLEIASSWLLTTLMHLFTSSKLATVWLPSSYEAWSSGVNGFNIILSHWCQCSLSSQVTFSFPQVLTVSSGRWRPSRRVLRRMILAAAVSRVICPMCCPVMLLSTSVGWPGRWPPLSICWRATASARTMLPPCCKFMTCASCSSLTTLRYH